jgi:hypothetical protein
MIPLVLGVFVVAVVVSLVTNGGVSDVAFVVYVVAAGLLIVLAIAALMGRRKPAG